MKKLAIISVAFMLACASLPTSSEYLARGEGYHKDGKPEQALKEYNKALKINPNNIDVYASRGAANFYLKNYEDAANDFITVIENQPTNAAAYNALGSALAALGRNDDALKFVSYAIFVNPLNAEALMSRAGIYYNLEQYQNAVDDLNAVIKIKPNIDAYALRALTYEKMGNADLSNQDKETIKAGGLPLHINSLVTY
ncbi:MAG: tetratricopeptide repeat protein [Elusimicrobium sp.]|jgi:tetratricopeptide (TPR) repeat protein|nr:tetratricopeptide repeat protein [Elusimicrobium sp.]